MLFIIIIMLLIFTTSIDNSKISLNETFQVPENISMIFDEEFNYATNDLVIQKCCEMNETYVGKVCLVNGNVRKLLRKFKFHGILMKSDFACDSDEVVVEYGSVLFDEVSFNNEVLILRNQNLTKFCVDFDDDENLTVRACLPESICDTIPCIRKCCLDGQKRQMLSEVTSHCVPYPGRIVPQFYNIQKWQEKDQIVTSHTPPVFGVLQGQSCSKYILDPDEDPYFLSHTDARLYINGTDITFPNDQYCHEILENGNLSSLEMFLCLEDQPDPSEKLLYLIGFSLSILGFTLTLVVYIFIIKIRNIHSRIIVCYCISFLIAYSFLMVTQYVYAESAVCMAFGYTIYFSFISGFVWLQIMCVDIWLKFSSTRSPEHKKSRRFLYYLGYSIFVPTLLLSIVAVSQHANFLPQDLRPSLGEDFCWFQMESIQFIIFFLLPVGVMTSINVVLFVLTMIHCNKIKMEIARVQRSSVKRKKNKAFVINKAIFSMNAKLFTIMGLSWILEIISAVFRNEHLWVITDIFNSLLGVLVFAIFVIKKRMIVLIKKKLGFKVHDEALATTRTMSTTGSNRNRILIKKST